MLYVLLFVNTYELSRPQNSNNVHIIFRCRNELVLETLRESLGKNVVVGNNDVVLISNNQVKLVNQCDVSTFLLLSPGDSSKMND